MELICWAAVTNSEKICKSQISRGIPWKSSFPEDLEGTSLLQVCEALNSQGISSSFCVRHTISWSRCSAEWIWGDFSFSLANFWRIAHTILIEFFQRILTAKFSAVFLQGFSPPPPPQKMHAQNCRHSSPISDFEPTRISAYGGDQHVLLSTHQKNSCTPKIGGRINFQKIYIILLQICPWSESMSEIYDFQCLEHGPAELHTWLSGRINEFKTRNKIT